MSAATESDTPIAGSKGHMGGTLIDVQDLVMHFPVTEGIIIPKVVANVKAVDGISFSIRTSWSQILPARRRCSRILPSLQDTYTHSLPTACRALM